MDVVEATSWWRRHRWSDVAIAAGATIAFSRWVSLADDPATLYQVVGGTGGGLIAFVVAPVATLLTVTGGARFTTFDRRHRPTIIRAMAWAFVLSLAALGSAVVGAAIDDSASPNEVARWAAVGAAAAAALAVGRLFWLFVAALMVRHADDDRPVLEDRA